MLGDNITAVRAVPDDSLAAIWVYLAEAPLFWLTATLVVFLAANRLYEKAGSSPLLNPVAISIAALIGLLTLTHTPYPIYFDGAKFIHVLLGPATVALAVPLYRQLATLRRLWLPVAVALVVGVCTAAVSAMATAWWFDASRETLLSLAPKSVTTPVAMGISDAIGGIPSLTAVLVVITGILGATFGGKILDLLRIRDAGTRGVAMGVTSHGIGTARAFQVGPEMGAFSGLAMALSALTSSALLPWLLDLLGMLQHGPH